MTSSWWLECALLAVLPNESLTINGGYDADVASAFVSSPTGHGALISDRVILTVGHVYPSGDGINVYKTSGKIRDPFRNAADAGEQSWTGTAIQHPKFDTCNTFEITVIILDTPLANLCAGANTPYALELPFNITTGAATVPGYFGINDGQLSECRAYGYGYYDYNRLHFAANQIGVYRNSLQTTCADIPHINYISYDKIKGNLCNGDSGGPNLCLYKGKWRLISLSKGISGSCDAATQSIYGIDLNDPTIKQWIRDTLNQYGATQSVIDAKAKCANVLQPIEAIQKTCEAGWTAYGSFCYKKEAVYKTQADADAACKAQGAQLASMHTVDEFKFLLNLAPAVNSGWPSIWIGLVRDPATGLFEWTDATTSTYYKNWATNYPEAATSGNNCVAMYPYDSGRWATANCGWQADAYVCKKV